MKGSDRRIVLPNLFGPDSDLDSLPWQPFREGVEIYQIYQDDNGERGALLRYQPGAMIPSHKHAGYEHIIVLRGEQSDDHGTLKEGSLRVNVPGTTHQVRSENGCVVLIIWERPISFL